MAKNTQRLSFPVHTLDDNGFRSFTRGHDFSADAVFQHLVTLGIHADAVLAIALAVRFLRGNPETLDVPTFQRSIQTDAVRSYFASIRDAYAAAKPDEIQRAEKFARSVFDPEIFVPLDAAVTAYAGPNGDSYADAITDAVIDAETAPTVTKTDDSPEPSAADFGGTAKSKTKNRGSRTKSDIHPVKPASQSGLSEFPPESK